MKTVKLRNLEIGAGIPKICAPITAKTKEGIMYAAKSFTGLPIDIVEWRVDYFENAYDADDIRNVLHDLRNTLSNIPILMTFRTMEDGGQKAIDDKSYAELIIKSANPEYVDLVDVEVFSGNGLEVRKLTDKIIETVHASNIKVMASYHNFKNTPAKEDLIKRVDIMRILNADICKLAVMPICTGDVITLLDTTEALHSIDMPIVTISMSKLGAISRISGEVFGSSITFGYTDKASAPGQISVNELNKLLILLHKTL